MGNDNTVTIKLSGRIDSNNAPQAEKEIMAQLEGNSGLPVILDADALEYVSSASCGSSPSALRSTRSWT